MKILLLIAQLFSRRRRRRLPVLSRGVVVGAVTSSLTAAPP